MADTQHTRLSGQSQADVTYADNTNNDIGASDWRQEQRDIYESSAILASQNLFSESNVLGEIDHVQAVGTTAVPTYTNTNENMPTLHVYSNTANPYAIAIENTNNSDADTKRFVIDQETDGDFVIIRVSESSGTDTENVVVNIDQNNYINIPGVYSETTASAANVFVDTDGSLRRSTSSMKYKTMIDDLKVNKRDYNKLRPVTFISKQTGRKHIGFIAEEVHEVGFTDLVIYNDGKPDALDYGHFTALNTSIIQDLMKEVKELKKEIKNLKNGTN